MESARLQAMLGKADEAKVKYQELVTRFPNSSFAAEAKTKLGTK
jgi:outer membrane protein assembly factor BamD (BamD/ComL family)